MNPRTIKGYGRCKRCKELVRDPDNCANCQHRNPLSLSLRDERRPRTNSEGNLRLPSLSAQEGDDE